MKTIHNPVQKPVHCTKSAPRLSDIAREVGVSVSEVSRALNNSTRAGRNVAPGTRERIRRAAAAMNYRPHREAQILQRGGPGIVGLTIDGYAPAEPAGALGEITSDVQGPGEISPHYIDLIGAFAEAFRRDNIHLMLLPGHGGSAGPGGRLGDSGPPRRAGGAGARTCDGVILSETRPDDPRPAQLREAAVPYLVYGPVAGDDDEVAVGIDEEAVGWLAVRALAERGHRRIVFADAAGSPLRAALRRRGALRAASETGALHGLEFRDIPDGAAAAEAWLNDLMAWLRGPEPPTALFVSDERLAISLQLQLRAGGWRVPQELSLLACRSARFMGALAPQLSVLRMPYLDSAEIAAAAMRALMRGDAPERRGARLLPPTLEVAGSLALPPTTRPRLRV